MSPTHDMIIDNSTGANVRADINNALAALVSNSSSSSEPATKYAYMWWADTTTGILKIRNSANNGWVELLQLDGTLTLEDGSASTPALAFRDDLDTGVFSSEANAFCISTAGVERIEFGTTECVVNDTGADVDFRIEGDTDANLFKIDAGNDRIGIGTSSPQVLMHLHQAGARLQFTNTNTGSASGDGIIMGINGDNDFFINNQESNEHILFFTEGTEVARFTDEQRLLIGTSTASTVGNSQYSKFEVCGNTSSATGASALTLKAGTTTASQTNGNTLGRLIFSTLDGGDYAYIQASIDGAMGSSDFPGRLMFFTCADNSSTATERIRIDSKGNVGIGATTISDDSEHCKLAISGKSGTAAGILIFQDTSNNEDGMIFADNGSLIFAADRDNATGSSFMAFRVDGSSEKMRLDSSGRLLVNTSTTGNIATKIVSLVTAGTSASWAQCGLAITHASAINRKALIGFGFSGNGGTNPPTAIGSISTNVSNFENAALVFYTRSATSDTEPSERVRINSAGHFLFSCTNSDDSTETGIKLFENDSIPYITNTIDSSSANHSFYHLYNKNASNNGYRFYVKQDGGIGNHSGNNTNLSDEREKKNITLMGSVYDTFKQFVFKDFNYISEDDTVTKKHGLIAQDVESIDSDLVAEDFKTSVDSEGNDILRKGLKEEQFMMIGFKALQEAIAKIEVLETKVAALEAA